MQQVVRPQFKWDSLGRLARRFVADHGRVLAPAAIAGTLMAAVYLSTLMWTITGCSAEYCPDVGEFQMALPVWGTVHYTGNPLYMLLGSPFVSALHAVGVAPSAGASLYSLVWEVIAVALVAGLITRLTRNAVLGVAGAMLFGVFAPIWVYGSVAEVYSLSMVITVAIVGLTFHLSRNWSGRGGWLLAFIGGLGVAHHRLIAVLLPAVGLYLLPAAWRSGRFGRWLAISTLFFLAGFLPYLDLPLRVWQGSTWNYDQVNTWNGFWRIFFATEVAGQQLPLVRLPELTAATLAVVSGLAANMTWPGLVATVAVAGVAIVQPHTRSWAIFLLGGLLSYLAFAVILAHAIYLEKVLMFPLALLVLLGAVGLSQLGQRGQWAAIAVIGIWIVWLVAQNYPFVADLTRNPSGVNYIDEVERLNAPPGAVVMAPWGARYFALAYAQRVDNQMPRWTIVDHRANMAALAAGTDGIYTDQGTLFVYGVDWWAQRLGSPLRITSAGPNLLEIAARPLASPTHPPLLIGDGIGLEGCEVRFTQQAQSLQVVLYWVAQHTTRTDYSTYVYASDHEAIVTLDDLVAQSDSAGAVYGWYPTTHWQAGEVVREDHLLEVPAGRPARFLFAGMYARDAAGHVVQLGRARLLESVNGDCTPQL